MNLHRIAIKGEGEQTPGDWCRFCRARAQCRARAEKNVELAFKSHDAPELMTLDEIGGYLERGEDVARWLKDLQEYALSQCLAGHEVAGWKAVEGRGSRDWTDQEEAFKRLEEHGIDEAMLYERKPLSLAQTEKLVGKKDFADTVGDLVVKKPGKIAIDDFANQGVATGPLPWNPCESQRPWSDEDDANYANYMESYYGIKGRDLLSQALTIVSGRHRFNHVKKYLKSLSWDGKKRLETLLIDYLGAEDNPYTRAVMRKSLCAAVARVMQDFVKFDYMPILTGPQGIGKAYR